MVNLNLFDDLYYNKLHEYEFSGEEAAPWAVTVSFVRCTGADCHFLLQGIFLTQGSKNLIFFFYPIDCNPPGSYFRGISQARILEQVAISYSRGST